MSDNPKYTFVFDVESIGLHGEGYAVGWTVSDASGQEIAHGREACHPLQAMGSRENRVWVADNCPPIDVTQKSARAVRDAFWEQFHHWRLKGAILVTDCGWPVEANFLSTCLRDDEQRYGPYPLHDLATMLLAVGRDPLGTFGRQDGELPKHDPLADARQSARIWWECIGQLRGVLS